MKKRILAQMLCLFFIFGLLTGCAQQNNPTGNQSSSQNDQAQSTPSEVKVYKIGASAAEGQPLTLAGQRWCDLVNERLAGQIKFEYYPAEQLGDESTQMENVQLNLQQGLTNSLDTYSNYSADLNIMSMAFAFDSQEHLNTYLESEYGQAALDKIADQGFHIVCYDLRRLPRCIFAKKPIETVDDLRGVKFRIADIPIWEKNFRTMGAVPTIIPWTEYYYALQQGVVEAGETALEGLTTMKFYAVAPYISLVDFAYPRECFVLSEQAWQGLTPEQQQIVTECGEEAQDYYNELIKSSWEDGQKEVLDGGGVFVEFERQTFIDKMAALVEELETEKFWDTPGLYDIVQEMK